MSTVMRTCNYSKEGVWHRQKMTSWLPRGTLLEYPNPEYLWAVKKNTHETGSTSYTLIHPTLSLFHLAGQKCAGKFALPFWFCFRFFLSTSQANANTSAQTHKTQKRTRTWLKSMQNSAWNIICLPWTPMQPQTSSDSAHRQVAESLLCFFFRANTSWMGFLDMCQSRRLRAPTCVVCKLAAAAARNSRK